MIYVHIFLILLVLIFTHMIAYLTGAISEKEKHKEYLKRVEAYLKKYPEHNK